ncbi:MAG: enoyl-CoA hydratase/isomerase family protein, partial [Acetobacteraceae bacterium]
MLNRPDSLNAISRQLRLELTDAFKRADDDPAVTVVVLRANGRSFCAGYDISGGGGDMESWRHDALKWHAYLAEQLEFEMIPWYMKKPVIASVQGHALGGGCELTMFCDMTIAADNALFGEPEVRFSNVGPAIVMPWLVGYKKARELLYFGDMITAEEALRLGMVNRVVPLTELQKATMKFARRLALIAPEALYAAKIAISRGADVAGFRNAMQAGLDMMGPLYAAKSEVGLEFSRITREQG